jgi:hypothetical protein
MFINIPMGVFDTHKPLCVDTDQEKANTRNADTGDHLGRVQGRQDKNRLFVQTSTR